MASRIMRVCTATVVGVSMVAFGWLGLPGVAQGRQAEDTEPTPRPVLSDAEAAAKAKELREVYSRPAAEWPKAVVDEGVEFVELGLLPPVLEPANNPTTKEKVELGKTLFFDPKLSGSGQFSCASCHDPDLAWADGRTVSFGHERLAGKRNAPSVMNAAYAKSLFWDGRAASLEEQAVSPIVASAEMNAEADVAVKQIAGVKEYGPMFAAAFGDDTVTLERITMSLAMFQRTVVGGRSKFDSFLKGNPRSLSDAAVRGLHLFRTDARCMNCHTGPTMSDGKFHDLGISNYGKALEDRGRYNITKAPKDMGAFRTPGLRNVTQTRPYMHSGLFELDEALVLYNAGMANLRPRKDQVNDPLFPKKSALLKPLGLNKQDLADLRAFLESTEESRARVRPPKLPGREER